MTDFGYPEAAVISIPLLYEVEELLLSAALREKTEMGALLYGFPVRSPRGDWQTWVLSAVPSVGKRTRATVEIDEETFRIAASLRQSGQLGRQQLVGWWHSQPEFGVNPSHADLNSLNTYFNRTYMLMIIDDPLRRERAVHAWHAPGRYRRIGYYAFPGNWAEFLTFDAKPTHTAIPNPTILQEQTQREG